MKLEELIGRQVHLIGDHPWAGYTGEVMRWDGMGLVVRLDTGGIGGEIEAGVLDPKHMMLLPVVRQRPSRRGRSGK